MKAPKSLTEKCIDRQTTAPTHLPLMWDNEEWDGGYDYDTDHDEISFKTKMITKRQS